MWSELGEWGSEIFIVVRYVGDWFLYNQHTKEDFSMKYLYGFGISTVPVTEACYNLFKLRIPFHLHD